MINISGFGLVAALTASATFPSGFNITEWADDADPLDSPDLEVTDTAMGVNGDFIVWSRPVGIEVVLNVIPLSPSDVNLRILLNANRVAKGKQTANDTINITATYPNGSVGTLANGVMVSGPPVSTVSSAGRLKTHAYKFRFESVSSKG